MNFEKLTDLKILAALCLILFFFGTWLVPVTDQTESCYTLTAKEMLQAGDWFSPRIYGNFWYDKPIFFYLELLVAYSIFGINDFAARFFPAVFASIGIFLTYFFAAKLYNKKVGFVAAVILATSFEYWYVAHAIITDTTLFCFMSVALMSFYFGYVEGKPNYYLLSYFMAGLAVLTKGPIGICLPGLIILIFLAIQKDLKHILKMKLAPGFAIFFVTAAVWYLPMYLMHGSTFFEHFLGVHNFLRVTVSEHPRDDVFYYYTVIFLVGFIPWNFPSLYFAAKKFWRERKFPSLDVRKKFLLTWALTVPIIFQCFATKYVTYSFPYMMPVAILFAGFFVEREKIFFRTAFCSVIFFIIAVFVSVPICNHFSKKDDAEILSRFKNEDAFFISSAGKYSATLVYYSGVLVWLLEEEDELEKIRPKEGTWTITNVMPMTTPEDLPQDKPIIAVVDEKSEEHFFKIAPGDWKVVAELPDGKIYRIEKFVPNTK